MPYDPTIYQGSAAHYLYGRPPYSPKLETVLSEEVGLDGGGRLLDAGCGPGTLTVRLAPLFEEAIGLDPDADMLAEGRQAAEEKGVTTIRWVQALAEDLPGVAPGPYRLVTFGQSFHWTDEHSVAEKVYDMLEPGGALALIVHTVADRPKPPSPGPPPIPYDEIKALVKQYLGSTERAGQGRAPTRTHRFEDVLVRTHFGAPRSLFVPGIPDLLRDSESVLSGYFSLSSSAPHLFGERVDDFAGDVRNLLASQSPDGIFWDWPGDTEVVLAQAAPSGPHELVWLKCVYCTLGWARRVTPWASSIVNCRPGFLGPPLVVPSPVDLTNGNPSPHDSFDCPRHRQTLEPRRPTHL